MISYKLDKINLIYILGLSIIIKFIVFLLFLYYNEEPFKYEYDYQKIIDNFFFKNLNINLSFGNERLPLYQFFLLLNYTIFKSKIIISCIQIVLSTFNLIIIYKIGKLFSRKFALILILVSTFNPSYILFSFLLIADYLFLLISLLFIYFFFKFLIISKLKYAIISFIFLGLMSLTKPVIVYFPIFLILFLIFFQKINKIKSIIFLIIIFYSINSSWIFRNYITYGESFYITQNSTNIINWYLPLIEQEEKQIDIKTARNNIDTEWSKFNENYPNKNNASRHSYEDLLSKKFFIIKIKDYEIVTLVKSWFYGSFKTLILPTFSEYKYFFEIKQNFKFSNIEGDKFTKKIKNYFINLKVDFYLLCLILSIFFTLLFRLIELKTFLKLYYNNRKIFFFLLIYISYFLVVSGPIGSARYRLPFEIIFIFTLSNWIYLLKKNK